MIHPAPTPSYGQIPDGRNATPIGWCDVARTPRKFSGKLIRLQAVLVENHNPGLIDGTDPQLYGAQCLDERFTTTIQWLGSSYNASFAHDDLDRARRIQNQFFVSRTNVILVGTFNGPHNHRYRGWADSEFVIRDVELAMPVAPNAPWPKWIDELEKKLRGITNRWSRADSASLSSTQLVGDVVGSPGQLKRWGW